ncbi:MAG: S41 family peptidase [Saprospiraceae bacterium]|nr:S41 family peptidase [Saprospiraceae bacterium]
MNFIIKIKRKLTIGFIALLGIAGISTELNDFEIAKNLELFSNIYRELNTYYVDEIDPEYLMESGLNAMLNSLDPYTSYIPADEVSQFRSTITGKYGGVGASIIQGKKAVLISLPYEGGPAQLAGLESGDKILEIDGENVIGNSIREISTKMRGTPNTEVSIKVERIGRQEPISMKLKRQEIKVNNIPFYKMLEGNIAYIVLSTFSENAGKNLGNVLNKLKEENIVDGVILDLRGNTGGLLIEAVNVANVFLDKGSMIVQTKGRNKDRQHVFRTLNPSVDNKIPVCIMINNASASASEIVAGSIQDLDRGVIVGQRSYGKGLVQNTKDLSFGAKVKLTTARYYIPSGRCIQSLQYKDGQPYQIADSLRNSFKTKGGRFVYDGGGIKPDIEIDNKPFLKIVKKLNSELFLFDYASEYKLNHDTIARSGQFQLTDTDFEQFLKFLDQKGYVYKTETEQMLDTLQLIARKEKYIDGLKNELDAIKSVFKNSKHRELINQKDRILHLLQRHIASRYYYQKGSIEAGLENDVELNRAQNILINKIEYEKLLSINQVD